MFAGMGRAITLAVVQPVNKVLNGANTVLNVAMVGELFGGEELEPVTGALRGGAEALAAGTKALEVSEEVDLAAAGGSLSAGALRGKVGGRK